MKQRELRAIRKRLKRARILEAIGDDASRRATEIARDMAWFEAEIRQQHREAQDAARELSTKINGDLF